MKQSVWVLTAVLMVAGGAPVSSHSAEIPKTFASQGDDSAAIRHLLDDYAHAVTVKDEHLFESLLLNTSVPFSSARVAIESGAAEAGTQNYREFARDVFGGPPFTQTFQDINILQDGPLASVSLVFVNETNGRRSWGWKTMSLLKVAGDWKIASEFYTGHSLD